MAAVKVPLLLILIPVIVITWFWANRRVGWPVPRVFSVVWVASAMQLGVSIMLNAWPDRFVQWFDSIVFAVGVLIVIGKSVSVSR